MMELSIFCFNAGFVFSEIQKLKPQSIIITSGTISPFATLEYELEAKFKHQFSGAHVIKNSQILPIICRRGATNTLLSSKFGIKFDEKKLIDAEYGRLVEDTCNRVVDGGGVLVFFSSYAQMKFYHEIWK